MYKPIFPHYFSSPGADRTDTLDRAGQTNFGLGLSYIPNAIPVDPLSFLEPSPVISFNFFRSVVVALPETRYMS